MRYLKRTPRRGYSLLELMVTVGIMSVVMLGMFQVFQEGMQLFRTNARAADAQKAAIKVLGLITAELVNATPEVSNHYPAGGPDLAGIVFATSLDDNGAARFDDITGEIYWRRYISYYFEPPPAGDFSGKVVRAVLPVPDEISGGPGDRNRTNDVSDFVTSNTTNFFAASAAAQKRLVSDGISGFDIEIYDGTEGGNTGAAATVSFEITVEAGNPQSLNLRNGYYIKVGSRVTPRG